MAAEINSSDNTKIKIVRRYNSKKYRDAEAKFIIEGTNLISEAIRIGANIDFILYPEKDNDINQIKMEGSTDVCNRAFSVENKLFNSICDAKTGIKAVAVVSKPIVTKKQIEKLGESLSNIVILDRLQDPGNIGTIIRTAVAAGYCAVVTLKGTADIFSQKVLRSTAGMIFDIPIINLSSNDELIDLVKKMNKRIVVTLPGGTKPYYESSLSHGIALVIGNEGNGISDELIEAADESIFIPMNGGIESLNASIAAALVMYETIRNRNE